MAPQEQRKADALQLIFSLFLGILLVVVIGVGVWTFYPQPFGANSAQQEQLEELYKEQEQLNMRTGAKTPTAAEQRELQRIQDEIDAINDAMQDERDAWAVNTSIILLSFATVLMAISLFLPEGMRVFSNGVLLGGVFTVIYGTGWSFAGGDSRARFWVVLVALLLSVAFGYLRFVRGRREDEREHAASAGGRVAAAGGSAAGGGSAGVSAEAAAPGDAAAMAALVARVEALEARAAAAAAALGGDDRS